MENRPSFHTSIYTYKTHVAKPHLTARQSFGNGSSNDFQVLLCEATFDAARDCAALQPRKCPIESAAKVCALFVCLMLIGQSLAGPSSLWSLSYPPSDKPRGRILIACLVASRSSSLSETIVCPRLLS
jgi:hypothetical protein